MVGEYDDNGQLIQEYSWKPNSVWMTDPLFTRTTDNRVHFYINDHLGTPQKAFRRNGKVTWKAKVRAFGETGVWAESELRNNLRFPGQYFGVETGLDYNYFPDYAPGLGRYVQSDPIGMIGGANNYVYGFSNSIIYFDELGLLASSPYCQDTGLLILSDINSGKTVKLEAESDGKPFGEPIPLGSYDLLERAGKDDFYRLDAIDEQS